MNCKNGCTWSYKWDNEKKCWIKTCTNCSRKIEEYK